MAGGAYAGGCPARQIGYAPVRFAVQDPRPFNLKPHQVDPLRARPVSTRGRPGNGPDPRGNVNTSPVEVLADIAQKVCELEGQSEGPGRLQGGVRIRGLKGRAASSPLRPPPNRPCNRTGHARIRTASRRDPSPWRPKIGAGLRGLFPESVRCQPERPGSGRRSGPVPDR